MRMPGYSAIGRFARLLISSVTWPSKAGSMNPAVLWITTPRRPRELRPSRRATRSSGMRTRSIVLPRTNSCGCRNIGSSGPTSIISIRSSAGCLTSIYARLVLRKTRNLLSRRTSMLDGLNELGVERIDSESAAGDGFVDRAVRKDHRAGVPRRRDDAGPRCCRCCPGWRARSSGAPRPRTTRCRRRRDTPTQSGYTPPGRAGAASPSPGRR